MIFDDLKPSQGKRSSVDLTLSLGNLNFNPESVTASEATRQTTDVKSTEKIVEVKTTEVKTVASNDENSQVVDLMTSSRGANQRSGERRRSSVDAGVPHSLTESLTSNDSKKGMRRKQPRAKSFDSEMLAIKKYVLTGESGIRKFNPDWEAAKMAKLKEHIQNDPSNSTGVRASFFLYPFANRSTALPIVSYQDQEDLFELDDDDSSHDGLSDDEFKGDTGKGKKGARAVIKATEDYEEAVQDYQSQWQLQALQEYENLAALQEYEDITKSSSFTVAVSKDNALDRQMQRELEHILERYEIPGGMLSKLMALENYGIAEIIVDDSGSMNKASDVVADFSSGANYMNCANETTEGPEKFLTRWAEAKERIMQMMELIAYIPTAPIFHTRFLNRDTVLELKREKRETPQAFLVRIRSILDKEFSKRPCENDGSPVLKCIRESFLQHHKHSSTGVLRYFMTHGVPDGREEECHKVVSLLMYRTQPERTPFTFLSCTDQDSDTEWMKECEEAAPYCSEFDDYMDESDEILRDQGKAFPYSYGLHLVGQLVAAFCPDDLDAMDESVPFPQPALADLLGYQLSDAEYKYYFESFMEAQRKQWSTKEDYQKEFVKKLPKLYEDFQTVKLASELVDVRNFRRRLKADAPNIALLPTEEELLEQAPQSPTRRWATKLFRANSLQKLFKHGKGKNEEPPSPKKMKNKALRRISN
mmetsp:Transcript_15855/g.30182  ORF Transcript_15855/g.30182 Transcript_15855/m.30182 type:complete len:704 (-) Transcript_15855:244-2355(-)|eukprot:scaffold23_cov175-Amphora_coffeaeformis.AAC.9